MKNSNIEYTSLHDHLGAMVSATTLFDIAHEHGTKLPVTDYHNFVDTMNISKEINHTKYLQKFPMVQKIQSSPAAIERCVYEAISLNYRKSNVTTMEIRFNPFLRNNTKYYDADHIILHACMGMKKAMLVYPVKVGLIIETDRTFTGDLSLELAKKAIKFKNEGIVGFDMSGFTPPDFDIMEHKLAFDIARDGGLGITIHAGEVDDIHTFMKIISQIKPDRIGHGIVAAKYPDVMELLADNNTVLEICPTSNIKTKLVTKSQILEILTVFLDNNVKFTLNSDGPVFLQTNTKLEYDYMLDLKPVFGDDIITKLAADANKYSFIHNFRSKWGEITTN